MRNFPKPDDSIGGIQKYWFVPVNDVAALGDIILNELQSITFKTDKDWITGYAVYDSKQFSEDKKENKTGMRFLRSLKMFYPGFDIAAVNQMAEMHITQFLVAYKDFNGLYKIAGTIENPLNFKYKLATGKTGSDAQGYDMEFFADSMIRISEFAEGTDPGPQTFDDWFLPSRDELQAMYDNLHLFGVGNFDNQQYWVSVAHNLVADQAYYIAFNTGGYTSGFKNTERYVRACRSFTSELGAYSLRDVGPSGGLIFYIDGTTNYEAAPNDQSIGQIWSNVDIVIILGTAIGTGAQNTLDIINQAGHTNSAAKLCDDLVIIN